MNQNLKPYELFNEQSQTFFYNLKAKPVQSMLDFDFFSQRNPSISAIIHPGREGFHKCFFGEKEILIPIYSNIQTAAKKHPNTDSLINFASFRSAYNSSKQALLIPQIKTITIVAEGIPEQQTKKLIALSKLHQKNIIGPSTVGGIVAGKFRIGHAGGSNDNILRAKLYRPGNIGLVSRSGGMMNEIFNIISRASNGIYEGIAIGGDAFPGSTLLNHILRFENNPEIKIIVALGEIGGNAEYQIIEAKKSGKITKPLIMWVSGTCAELFPWKVQFGHAGAQSTEKKDTAQVKNIALKEAGIIVPNSFEEFENVISKTYKIMTQSGSITDKEEITPPEIPPRTKTNFVSTISDDRGIEPKYNNKPLSEIVKENKGLGEVIGLLWFKKSLPSFFTKFLELCITLTADHGPAVSGAHNAIIAARAGKDIISSLASGLLTIGPRFGGAIDAACRYFREACNSEQQPKLFVEEMKQKGIRIPGIGHRVKSKTNPDIRVKLLVNFAEVNLNSNKYLNYALAVEQLTLKKSPNLILNVDGCMAAVFLDCLVSAEFTQEEIKDIVEVGYMNGLFAVSRSIGMVGHILDQKRLKEPLYRHPTKDILYHTD